MTSHKCQCGKCIIYSNVKDTTVECKQCKQVYTVDKDGKLQPQPPIEEFNLNMRDPFKEK